MYLVRFHGDDGAEGEDEGMYVLLIEVECGHSIRHRVVGQHLGEQSNTEVSLHIVYIFPQIF